jgi:hypothetical protein
MPRIFIGHETYAAKLAKGSVLLTGDGWDFEHRLGRSGARWRVLTVGEERGGSGRKLGDAWALLVLGNRAISERNTFLRPLALFAELWARNAQEAQTSARVIGVPSRVVSFRSAPPCRISRARLSAPGPFCGPSSVKRASGGNGMAQP